MIENGVVLAKEKIEREETGLKCKLYIRYDLINSRE